MGAYLDRLHSEFDECSATISTVLERAVTENRDPSEDEQSILTRSESRRVELEKAIDVQTSIETRTQKVAGLRGKAPAVMVRSIGAVEEKPYDVLDDIPTAGHFFNLLHRATVRHEAAANEILERATMATGDNAGTIPRPLLGGVVDIFKGRRRFIDSLGGTRQAPTNKFGRPHVTQNVGVGTQAAEHDALTSQKMTIEDLAVVLQTIGGYLDLSKQDVRWSNPDLLNIIFTDFAKVYAKASNTLACSDFVAQATVTEALDLSDVSVVANTVTVMDTFLAGAAADLGEDVVPDTLWVSTNFATILRKPRDAGGRKAYNVPFGNEPGDIEGLRLIVDPHFATSTMILGASEYCEVYEDIEGFLSVDQPSTLGQRVGYAGYIDTLVTDANAFSKAAVVA